MNNFAEPSYTVSSFEELKRSLNQRSVQMFGEPENDCAGSWLYVGNEGYGNHPVNEGPRWEREQFINIESLRQPIERYLEERDDPAVTLDVESFREAAELIEDPEYLDISRKVEQLEEHGFL